MEDTLVKTAADLGKVLASVRKARKMSRRELGEKCGMTNVSAPAMIGRYENGKSMITPEMLNKLTDALEIDLIITIKDRRNPDPEE